jgi:hypothetical protein
VARSTSGSRLRWATLPREDDIEQVRKNVVNECGLIAEVVGRIVGIGLFEKAELRAVTLPRTQAASAWDLRLCARSSGSVRAGLALSDIGLVGDS